MRHVCHGNCGLLTLDTQKAPVTNTFIASGGGKLADSLTLQEHVVTKAADGSYSIAENAATISENRYDVMPGMVLPKDPFITITNKTAAPAYLYIEVVDTLTPGIYNYAIHSQWEELTDVTGPNGGKVYVLGDEGPDNTVIGTIITSTPSEPYYILANNQIVVNPNVEPSTTNETMTFYAYLAQATVATTNDTGATVNTSNVFTVFDVCF